MGVRLYVFVVFGKDAEEEEVFGVMDCLDDESVISREVEE